MNEKILVIDDEEAILESLADILEDEGYQVITAKNAAEGLQKVKQEQPDLLILDVWLPDQDGLKLLKTLRKESPDLPVIVISGHGTVETAVKAIKLGAFDFLEKPLSYDRVVVTVANALKFRALREENITLKRHLTGPGITGQSHAILELREAIERVAQTDATVLITGESGVGKEVAARMIHTLSRRAEKPFVAVNCAAIPEDLIESELFGHEKGAFTGAVSSKKGKFDLADGGTIFLDEIGDMSLSAQAKVLRVLQEKCFERVGGTKTISVDVRVIAATNKNLTEEIKKGRFREDLYYRLNVIPIHIPPLRERPEDIPLLVEEFLDEFARHSGLGRKKITPEAMEALKRYPWPGNIRELRNLIERLVILSKRDTISLEDLPPEINQPPQTSFGQEPWFECNDFKQARSLFEREFLKRKLAEFKGNISQTAEAIGLERTYLHRKLKALGLSGES
ncbi:two component, sigma54 specific, transcriptional regulator, Fis family [Thermodesulfatator indicus DSM 15286]|uniref:Two component, sigma54 specific, transcriptional regulator, Fis family n=1 Tax=Thermodesulfatator indicus (strain DSM 15286 / JCM 11887 / CIR29812) TaxID=667014 RepID=F8A837_THEID|nr:sigma-54 dependent transcriptional regulator [Thermodesulfatator indicus]AEH45030.1 two component, sigma54 specific, transcriptional regulator, Fis family [Thermodesulfatator indicus DSM 15286]